MSILSKFEVRATPDRVLSMTPLVSYKETSEEVQNSTIPFARRYNLVATIRVGFTANNAMYEDARMDAERMIHVGLFRDLIPLAYECKDAIRAGNALDAYNTLDKLLHMMNGGD